jgi:hypothetical protein
MKNAVSIATGGQRNAPIPASITGARICLVLRSVRLVCALSLVCLKVVTCESTNAYTQ